MAPSRATGRIVFQINPNSNDVDSLPDLQLEDGEGWDGEPYALNFGGGYGFLFLSADDREGAFFWDCS